MLFYIAYPFILQNNSVKKIFDHSSPRNVLQNHTHFGGTQL